MKARKRHRLKWCMKILVNLYMMYLDPSTRGFRNVRSRLWWFLTRYMEFDPRCPPMTVQVRQLLILKLELTLMLCRSLFRSSSGPSTGESP